MTDFKPWTLVGGGLFNGLLALRLLQRGRDFRLFEKGPALVGDHTWSFHEHDISEQDLQWLEPMVTCSWPRHSVEFPEFRRTLNSGYLTLRSADLRKELHARIPSERIVCNHNWTEDSPQTRIVIRTDAGTGALAETDLDGGWQKFTGWDIEMEGGHGLAEPVLMDATVEQREGFRFMYLLPFDENRILVEDTRYSNSPAIDATDFANGLSTYIKTRWPGRNWSVTREEKAALPIPTVETGMRGRFGMAGGFFHPTTGYSLPSALRVSEALIELVDEGLAVSDAWRILNAEERPRRSFYLMLNRMLFFAAKPEERWRIFARFYGLNENLIQRFYAGRSTALDKARILMGRPPVPVVDAVRALWRNQDSSPWI